MKNMLVAVDFDPNEQPVLDHAARMAAAFGSKLWLLHIAAPDPDFVGYEVGPQSVRNNRAHELRKELGLLQDYIGALRKKGIDAEAMLIPGTTIATLLEEAEKLNADLIVAGHHEHGLFHRAFAESVSAGLIRRSRIPVLLVPVD